MLKNLENNLFIINLINNQSIIKEINLAPKFGEKNENLQK